MTSFLDSFTFCSSNPLFYRVFSPSQVVADFCRMWDFMRVPAQGRAWNIFLISYSWQHSFWDERCPLRGRREKDLRVELLLPLFLMHNQRELAWVVFEGWPQRKSILLESSFWTAAFRAFSFSLPWKSSTPALGLDGDCVGILPRCLCLCFLPVCTVIILKGNARFASDIQKLVGCWWKKKMPIAWFSK